MGSAGSAGAPVKRSALWEDPEPFTLPGKKSPGLLAHARVAGLAHGAVFGRDGDTIVLATVVSDRRDEVAVGDGGTPLNVDYKEKPAASGRIPRTPNRREMNNNEGETLTGRAIDRCLRPLFPPLYSADTQVTATVQAFDQRQAPPPVSLATNACSAALHASDVPWAGPLAAVRVALVRGSFVAEPTSTQLLESTLDLVYAGNAKGNCLMLEVAGYSVGEQKLKEALRFAQAQLGPLLDAQEALAMQRNASKRPVSPFEKPAFENAGQGPQDSPPAGAESGKGGWLGSFLGGQPQVSSTVASGPSLVASGPTLVDYAIGLALEIDGGEAKSLFGAGMERAERSRAEARLMARVTSELKERLARQDSGGASSRYLSLPSDAERARLLSHAAHEALWLGMRSSLMDAHLRDPMGGVRCDGRGTRELRGLEASLDVLPAVHGSALFRRGNTEVLCTATLGPASDSVDPSLRSNLGGPLIGTSPSDNQLTSLREPTSLKGHPGETAGATRRMLLHYEFPAFSTGEVGGGVGPNRRALGHGALAQKALDPVMPPNWRFPYVARLAAEVLSSNGSSSMASACAGSLALLDAGVPILAPVAGVSVGLVSRPKGSGDNLQGHGASGGAANEGDLEYVLLTDILGLEDHYGDMDFKVCGTRAGVTAVQLDVKLQGGVPLAILEEALDHAKDARARILDTMEEALLPQTSPTFEGAFESAQASKVGRGLQRGEAFESFMQQRLALKPHAPRLRVVRFKRDRLPFLLGPGGRSKRSIEQEFECAVDLGDIENEAGDLEATTGVQAGEEYVVAHVFAASQASCEAATRVVQELVCDVEPGTVLSGEVKELRDYGAVLEVLRGRLGLLHVSEMGPNLRGALKVGQILDVKCLAVDPLTGNVKLTGKFGQDAGCKAGPGRAHREAKTTRPKKMAEPKAKTVAFERAPNIAAASTEAAMEAARDAEKEAALKAVKMGSRVHELDFQVTQDRVRWDDEEWDRTKLDAAWYAAFPDGPTPCYQWLLSHRYSDRARHLSFVPEGTPEAALQEPSEGWFRLRKAGEFRIRAKGQVDSAKLVDRGDDFVDEMDEPETDSADETRDGADYRGYFTRSAADTGPLPQGIASEAEIQDRLRTRALARIARDFEKADRILAELTAMGVECQDAIRKWRCDGLGFDKSNANSVYIGKLPEGATEETLRDLLAPYGVGEIRLLFHNRNKGNYAFADFADSDSAKSALVLDGTEIQGHTIRVEKNHEPRKESTDSVFIGNLPIDVTEKTLRRTFGSLREIRRKAGTRFAFMTFADSDSVDAALEFSGTEIEGRTIRVEKARVQAHRVNGHSEVNSRQEIDQPTSLDSKPN